MLLTGVINPEDWDEIKENIALRYQTDNYFSELKKIEIINNRIEAAKNIEDMLGKFFSVEYIAKQIFMMSDAEIIKEQSRIAAEYKNHPYWYSARNQYDAMQAMNRAQINQMQAMQQDPNQMQQGVQ